MSDENKRTETICNGIIFVQDSTPFEVEGYRFILNKSNSPVENGLGLCLYTGNGVKKTHGDKYNVSYYCGLANCLIEETNQNDVVDSKRILIRSTPRVKMDVVAMLNTVLKDDKAEYKKYQEEESMVCMGRPIDLSNVVLPQEIIDQIKKEFELVKTIYDKKDEIKEGEIYSYAINMSALYECFVRTKLRSIQSEWEVLDKNDAIRRVCKENDNASSPLVKEKGEKVAKFKKLCHIDGTVIPDVVLKSPSDIITILDVKYKDVSNRFSDDARVDRFQLLAYANLYGAKTIGFVFPSGDKDKVETDYLDIPTGYDSKGRLSYKKVKYVEILMTDGLK